MDQIAVALIGFGEAGRSFAEAGSWSTSARVFDVLTDDPASADNVAAWDVLSRFDRPVLCAFSDQDPITKGGDAPFLERIPGAAGQPHTVAEGGGHFLQEDCGPQLAQTVIDFIDSTV